MQKKILTNGQVVERGHRIVRRLAITGLVFIVAALGAMSWVVRAEAAKRPPCSVYACQATLHANSAVKHWTARGNVGEQWLLYLNVYSGGKRLSYKRLPGGCEAAYAGAGISVLLHACGHRSRLDYVAFRAPKTLKVEYRYVRR